MFQRLICLVSLAFLLIFASVSQADTFSLRPTQDTYVANDTTQGPTSINSSLDGIHARNIATRRRVGYIKYDISALKKPGRVFSNVSLSNRGWDRGNINVYGLIESVDSIDVNILNWNNAPGVKNNPTPALASPVALDFNDLTEQLLPTFMAPARNTRESTPPSQALADFLNSDRDGVIVLLLAPAAAGDNATILAIDDSPDSGTLLEGEFSGFPKTAYNPVPNEADDISRDVVLSWTPGGYADKHNVYLGTDFDDVNEADENNVTGILVSKRQDPNTYPVGLLAFDTNYYWRVDEVNAPPNSNIFYRSEIWSFTTEPFTYPLPKGSISAIASKPTVQNMGAEKTCDESGLNVNDQHSILPTDMWLIAATGAEPIWIKYTFDNIYELDQMWVWNSNQNLEFIVGIGLKNVTIDYSTDDSSWKRLENVPDFNQATGLDNYTYNTTVDFDRVLAQYVRINVNNNWGGMYPQFGLSEVRFFYIPVRARGPQPASGGTGVLLDATLTWRPGREAVSHEVYLSSDSNAVRSGTAFVDTVNTSSFALGSLGLELGKTYYWKVNEVNEAAVQRVWEGDLWSFTTTGYITVDDFEQYDTACNRVYFIWEDGIGHDADPACGIDKYDGNKSGSTVGSFDTPFVETTIVRSPGMQSMPLEYNNASPPYYSEAQRQWASPQDWTKGGAKTLTVWFYGVTTNVAEGLYIAIEDSTGARSDAILSQPAAVQSATWQQGDITLTSFAGVNLTMVKKMYIGVGNRTTPAAGGAGKLYIDDIRLY